METYKNNVEKTDTERIWKDANECHTKFHSLIQKGRDPDKVRKKLKEEYDWLEEEWPRTFKICCDPTVKDLSRLKGMLDTIKRVQSGQKTIGDATAEFGKKMAREYVYPNLDMTKETGIKDTF